MASLTERIPDTLRSVFDDGLDEVLVFAFVFIFLLLSGKDKIDASKDSCGIPPLIVMGIFILLFAILADTREDNTETNINY